VILRALFLRPTLRRPARFAATIGGVSLGIAAVVSTFAGSRSAVAALAEDVTALAGERSLEIARAGGLDERVMSRLAPFCSRWSVVPLVEEIAHLPALGEVVRVIGFDPMVETRTRERLGTKAASTLEDPESLEAFLREPMVLLSRALAGELHVARGDALDILARGKRVELHVAGLFDVEASRAGAERALFVDIALAQELFGRQGLLDRIVLRPRTTLDFASEKAALAAALPPEYVVREPELRAAESRRMVSALDFNLQALSGVSVLVGIVLVATALATSVVQRRERIALLRSLGASRAQLTLAVFAESLVIGLAGGAIGVVLGWLGSRAALAGVRGSYSSIAPSGPSASLVFDPAWVLLGIALGAGASAVAGLLPLREALRTPPIQGLRGQRSEGATARSLLVRAAILLALFAGAIAFARLPPLGDRPVWALCSALCLLASLIVLAPPIVDGLALARIDRLLGPSRPPMRLAQASLEAGRRRAAWAAGAVGIAMALAISMTVMIGSFRRTLVEWNEQALRSDLFVKPLAGSDGVSAGRLDPEVERTARELFGDPAIDAFVSAEATVAGEPITLAGADFPVALRESTIVFVDRRPPREVFEEALERAGCVVNESFARRFGLARGDRVVLETAGTTLEAEIAGVYRSYSHPMGLVVIDRAAFALLHPRESPESLAIFLPDGRSPEEARAELLDALGARFAVEVLPNAELRRQVFDVFDRTFAVTGALRLVASAVAVIAVLTVLFALVHERARELALVRVLGASRAQVLGMVALEGGLLGAAGALGGLVIGVAVGWILVKIVNVQSFGWTIAFLPPWGAIALTVLAALVASLVAGLVPAARALRLVAAEVLREEG
jgi:putative ABC transport system permease protein